MYPHCTVRIRLLYAFNKYFDFDFDFDKQTMNHSEPIHDSVIWYRTGFPPRPFLIHMYALYRPNVFYLHKSFHEV